MKTHLMSLFLLFIVAAILSFTLSPFIGSIPTLIICFLLGFSWPSIASRLGFKKD